MDWTPQRLLLLAVGVLLLAGGGALYATGALDGLADPEYIRALVDGQGALGPLVFIAIAMALFPLMLFGPAVWASMLLWSWPLALFYSFTAAMVASVLSYALARRGGEARQVPEKLERYRQGLLERPIATVFALRILLWANPVVDVLIAVSGVPMRPYLLGTLLGMLPPTVFHLFVGAGLQRFDELPAEVWLVAGALLVTGGGLWALHRRRVAQAQ